MTCNCHSYNWDIGETPQVVVPAPDHLKAEAPSGSICLDACIAKTVKHLWNNGVYTLSTCCGHNRRSPHIVIASEQSGDKVRSLISEVDDRSFEIMQWQLKEV